VQSEGERRGGDTGEENPQGPSGAARALAEDPDATRYIYAKCCACGRRYRGRAGLAPLIKEYNDSITNLRKKEYVYFSWISRYWGKSKISELSVTYDAIRAIDTAFHNLNDEFEAVNITKSKQTVDSERAKQVLTRLHPALQKLQESSKTLLTDLQ
jgi:hypothetical protein